MHLVIELMVTSIQVKLKLNPLAYPTHLRLSMCEQYVVCILKLYLNHKIILPDISLATHVLQYKLQGKICHLRSGLSFSCSQCAHRMKNRTQFVTQEIVEMSIRTIK